MARRQAEAAVLEERAVRRGRRAANRVRLGRIKAEVEGQLTALERAELERRRLDLAAPRSRVVQTQQRLELEAKRQTSLERAFEGMYLEGLGSSSGPPPPEAPRGADTVLESVEYGQAAQRWGPDYFDAAAVVPEPPLLVPADGPPQAPHWSEPPDPAEDPLALSAGGPPSEEDPLAMSARVEAWPAPANEDETSYAAAELVPGEVQLVGSDSGDETAASLEPWASPQRVAAAEPEEDLDSEAMWEQLLFAPQPPQDAIQQLVAHLPETPAPPGPAPPATSLEPITPGLASLRARIEQLERSVLEASDDAPAPEPVEEPAPEPAEEPAARNSPARPGALYGLDMQHLEYSSSDGELERTLDRLVQRQAVHSGQPPVAPRVAAAPLSPRPEGLEMAAPEAAAPPALDVGARDYRVSRVNETHPHTDLHDLLPVWQDHDQGSPEQQQSLQEAFRRHKQGFVRKSAARMSEVAKARTRPKKAHPLLELGRRRYEERLRLNRERAAEAEEPVPQPLPPAPAPPQRLLARQPGEHMSKAAMRKQNERLYRRLCPEVKKQAADAKRAEEYAAHKKKAEAYATALRQRQLKRRRR